jgi:hypothetical protein
MINITQTGSTLVALTLSEKVTLTTANVYFLFEIQSQDTNAITYFTAPDISSNPLRYNLFTFSGVTSSGAQNLTAGTVYYSVPGYYQYACYQMTGQTNTSLTGVTGGPIELGKMLVSGTSTFVGTNVRAFTAATPELRYVFQ